MRISNGIQNRNRRMRNRTYGGVRGRKTKVGRKLLRFPPTRFSCISRDGLTEKVAAGLAAFSVFRGAECGVSGVKKIYEGV